MQFILQLKDVFYLYCFLIQTVEQVNSVSKFKEVSIMASFLFEVRKSLNIYQVLI